MAGVHGAGGVAAENEKGSRGLPRYICLSLEERHALSAKIRDLRALAFSGCVVARITGVPLNVILSLLVREDRVYWEPYVEALEAAHRIIVLGE